MPGGDRTGPWELGPRTGRAAGYCAGYNVPGYANPGSGRGFGFGGGRGRGFGRGYWRRGRGFWGPARYPYPEPYYPEPYLEPSRDEEKTYLENMMKGLEEEIKQIRERLQELSKEKKEDP
ncbi:MAG: DUF5320 domain-containing protein [Candidatus Thermoplasmatota archaeon]|nr:DUF5320 domain-containing protein [Candidatus Thermoplasmatota archaeon]